MDPVDERLLGRLQEGIPITTMPFDPVAERSDLAPEEVVRRIRALVDSGVLRRFGARLDQHRLGLAANAMIAWRVPDERVTEVGARMAASPEVTHCYERRRSPGLWEYNLYTVVHAPSRGAIEAIAAALAAETGIDDRLVLVSTAEYMRRPAAWIPGAP